MRLVKHKCSFNKRVWAAAECVWYCLHSHTAVYPVRGDLIVILDRNRSISVFVEYYNKISTYGIMGCRSACVATSDNVEAVLYQVKLVESLILHSLALKVSADGASLIVAGRRFH